MTERRGALPVDRLTLVFVALLAGFVALHASEVEAWPWLLGALALVAVLLTLLARAPAASALMSLLGPGYPIIIASGFYTALGLIAESRAVLHDLTVQRWEQALFGGQASVEWHRLMPDLTLSTVLHACYGAYYPIIAGVVVWFWRRKSGAAFARVSFLIALAFYVCYLLFALYPVAGPRYFFGNADGPIAQVLPARIVRAVLERGSAYGTAFPSSHVAASWVAVLASWKEARGLALGLAPVALGLALGTVYGQFHYAVDGLAGAVLAVALFALGGPLSRFLEPGARR